MSVAAEQLGGTEKPGLGKYYSDDPTKIHTVQRAAGGDFG